MSHSSHSFLFSRAVRSDWVLVAGGALVIAVLVFAAGVPRWAVTLWLASSNVYFQHVEDFSRQGVWPASEYQPGALFSFLVPEALARFGVSYAPSVAVLNVLLLAAHVVLIRAGGGRRSAFLALLFFLTAGPISLFGFELVASFLVLFSFVLWRARRTLMACAVLGLATTVKVYPIVLLPLLLLPRSSSLPGGSLRRPLAAFMAFVAGVALPTVAYLQTGGTWHLIAVGLQYHAEKPVTIQSVLGVGVSLFHRLSNGRFPDVVWEKGVLGFRGALGVRRILLAGFVVSIAGVYLERFRRRQGDALAEETFPQVAFLVLLSLLVWPSILQPQYFLWPLAFAALAVPSLSSTGRRVLVAGLYAATLLASQVLFPALYWRLQDALDRGDIWSSAFMVYVSIAVLLVCLYLVVVWEVWARFRRSSALRPGSGETR